ncbi:MAG: acyltransferase [Psychroserpens sp.]|uniref:acyltransferase family protein n=1 Tax=Psychroserpens sp. TaxID=2020870 RepID=UPI003002E963
MIKDKFNKLFFPNDNKTQHFKSLDGLRGIAVLLVLLSHSSNTKIFIHKTFDFHAVGKVGVYLFFVLSAYLLDRQIALAFMTKKSSIGYWKNYFLRRFLRIYPLFVIALILHGLLNLAGIKTVIDRIIDIPLHMALLRGESIFWSIPVEFKYYLISPLIMWFCNKFLKWNAVKLFFVFILLILTSIAIEVVFELPLVSTFKYFPIFLIGTMISIYELLFKNYFKNNIEPKLFSITGLIAFALILITIPFYFEKISGFKVNFHSPIFYFPYAFLWGIILLSAKYGKGIIKYVLELKFLRFIGVISFSLYLFHMLVLNYVKQAEIPTQFKFYTFFIISIVFATVSYLIIERPLSKIKIYSNEISEKDIKKRQPTPNKFNC